MLISMGASCVAFTRFIEPILLAIGFGPLHRQIWLIFPSTKLKSIEINVIFTQMVNKKRTNIIIRAG